MAKMRSLPSKTFILFMIIWIFFLDASVFMFINSYIHSLYPDVYIGFIALVLSFVFLILIIKIELGGHKR